MRTLLPIFQNIGERCPDLVPGKSQVLCIQLSAFFLRLSARLRHAPPPKSDFKRKSLLREISAFLQRFYTVNERCGASARETLLIANGEQSGGVFIESLRVPNHSTGRTAGHRSPNTVRTQVADVALTHAVATAGGSIHAEAV